MIQKRLMAWVLAVLLMLGGAAYAEPTVSPAQDFYAYANQETLRKHPAADSAEPWSAVSEVRALVAARETELFHQLASNGAAYEASTAEFRIAALVKQLRDTQARNAHGIAPILPALARVEEAKTAEELLDCSASLMLETGTPFFIGFDVYENEEAGTVYATVEPAAYSLDFADDGAEVRSFYPLYAQCLQKVFTAAQMTVTLEAMNALIALMEELSTEMGDQVALTLKRGNAYDVSALDAQNKHFSLGAYLAALGMTNTAQVQTVDPDFLMALDRCLTAERLPSLKLLCQLQLMRTYGGYLSDDFAAALQELGEMELYMAENAGVSNAPAFEAQAYQSTYADAEEADLLDFIRSHAKADFAEAYANAYAPKNAQGELEKATKAIVQTLQKRIAKQEWMTEKTRAAALDKLAAIKCEFVAPTNNAPVNTAETLFDTMAALRVSHLDSAIEQINSRAAYRLHWEMTADTVNACYDNVTNTICVPCGILSAPFYDENAVLGSIGLILAHELTHGFDQDGATYDGDGNRVDWWAESDRAAFLKKVDAVEQYYQRFPYREGHVQQGEVIIGECVADLGALGMITELLEGDPEAQRAAMLCFAAQWVQSGTDEQLDGIANVGKHPLGRSRVNAAIASLDVFYECFEVNPGDAMYVAPEDRVKIW
ncbi:MAG: M13 family metallopeptidase [Clostridia bacterium]